MTTRKILEFVSPSIQTTSTSLTTLLDIDLVNSYGVDNTVCRARATIIGKNSSNQSGCIRWYDIFYVSGGTMTQVGYGQSPFTSTGSVNIFVGAAADVNVSSNHLVVTIAPGSSTTTNWTAWLDVWTAEI